MELADDIRAYMSEKIDPNDSRLKGVATDLDMKERVKQATILLLRFAPGRYRFFAQQCNEAPNVWRIRQMNEYLEKVYREVVRFGTLENMEKQKELMVTKTKTITQRVEKVLNENDNDNENENENDNDNDNDNENENENQNQNDNDNQNKTTKQQNNKTIGKRLDHDSLPRKIQAIYEDNLNILQSQRSAHEKAKLLVQQVEKMIEADKPICDIEEACHTIETTVKDIMDLNDKRIYNWSVYDNYDPDDEKNNENGTASVVRPLEECDDEALRKYLRKASLKLMKHKDEPASKQWYENALEGAALRINELRKRGVELDPTTPVGQRLRDCGLI